MNKNRDTHRICKNCYKEQPVEVFFAKKPDKQSFCFNCRKELAIYHQQQIRVNFKPPLTVDYLFTFVMEDDWDLKFPVTTQMIDKTPEKDIVVATLNALNGTKQYYTFILNFAQKEPLIAKHYGFVLEELLNNEEIMANILGAI